MFISQLLPQITWIKQEEKQSDLSDYFWNKGGIKLFRFREYGPISLNKVCLV